METKQIMLVCAAGMSTSLMVSKMEKAAQDQGLDAHIFAVPVPEASRGDSLYYSGMNRQE